ncbi:toxin-activating lysine-acyltransferase [Bacillus sp. NP157]|nr:toxin-activating lysine-acyltransferase [Bacillus sp. NP157]
MQEHFEALGKFVYAMMRNDTYCRYPVASITLWLEPAAYLGQVHFFTDLNGQMIGYMTWAWLTAEAEQRLIEDPEVLLHLSEWNEGERLWVLDFVVLNGDVGACLRTARTLFPHVSSARSLRRDDEGRVKRVSTWKVR